KCPVHGRPVIEMQEENYFFRLSAFEAPLLEYYESHPDFVRPVSKRNEALGFVRGGLNDVSITRTSFRWGVPVPWDDGHVFYVWYDALINYLTLASYGSDPERFAALWDAAHHLIGKDILKFHCVWWPAMCMAAGVDPPEEIFVHGYLLIGGQKLGKSMIAAGVAAASPYVDMPMRLTVRQNLTIFGRLYAVENLRERIERLAADLDLGDFLDRANGKLSAGQKTRVALAKALINQPELLLLDEPTASLDPDTADWIRQHLETYRKENAATILLASHNMLEVERLCDRVIIMKRGRIEDDDSPDKIMARYNRTTLEEVFLDVARGRVQEGTP
ncbi:MAG: class I tRNA ligase family protein, partial [Bradyrhizobium sp.]